MTLFVRKFQPKKLIKICATNKPVAATDSLYTFYIFLLFHLQNCRHAAFEYKHFFGFSRNFIFSKQKNRNKSNNKPYFIATLASARAISPWNLCVFFFCILGSSVLSVVDGRAAPEWRRRIACMTHKHNKNKNRKICEGKKSEREIQTISILCMPKEITKIKMTQWNANYVPSNIFQRQKQWIHNNLT